MKTYEDDLDLVVNSKLGHEKSLFDLWEKYLPLINKFGRKTALWTKNSTVLEDFVQDAFFSVKSAVEYIDCEKVPQNFCFYIFLWNELQKQSKKEYLNFKKLSFKEMDEEKDETIENLAIHQDEDRVLALTKEELMSSLTQRQKTILAFRREGLTIAEIVKKVNFSDVIIMKEIKKAKVLASEIFDVNFNTIGYGIGKGKESSLK